MMRKSIYIIIMFCCVNKIKAQQNLFNVPSSDITPKGNHFIQYQANLSSNSLQNNLTYTYGFGKGFEGGINLFGLNIINHYKPHIYENVTNINLPYNPLIMVNLQKGHQFSQNFKIGIGTQTGSSLNFRLCNFSFLNTNTNLFNNHLRIIGGVYYSNKALTGDGNSFGFITGMEIPLFKERFVITSDYVSGKNYLSVGVIGCAIKIFKHLVFSAGYQYPGFHSPNNEGIVFELTKI